MCLIIGVVVVVLLLIIVGLIGSAIVSGLGLIFGLLASILVSPYFWIALIVIMILGFISENATSCFGCFTVMLIVLGVSIYLFFNFILTVA